MAGNSLIGNLAVSLTLNTAAFQNGATLAEKRAEQMKGKFAAVGGSLKGLGAGLAAGVAFAGLSEVVSSAFEMASALSESAEQIGVTVEALQELRFAADQTGVGADKLDASIIRMNKTIGQLILGAPAASKAFDKIGLSADDLRGKAPEEQFRIIAEALNRLPDAQARVAIGNEIFGKSFSQLLPMINGGREALDKYADQSRENGQISAQDAARLDELADRWDRFKTRVALVTATLISRLAEWAQKTGEFFDGINKWAADTDAKIAAFGRNAVKAISDMVTGIGNWINGRLKAIFDFIGQRLDWLGEKWGALTQRTQVSAERVSASFMRMADVSGFDQFGEMAEDVTDRVTRSFKDMADNTLSALGRVSSSIEGGGFLDIIGSVIGLGLQLGGLGAFGGGVAGRINGTQGVGGSGGTGRGGMIEVVPSPYFDLVVDGRVARAAPSIAQAGGQVGMQRAAYRQARLVG